MENESLFTNMQEKHVAQVTGTILLIRNTNRQQFTSNNSNDTFNSAQLTGFPDRTADETPKSLQSINTLLLCDPSAVLLYSPRQAVTSHGITRKNLELWRCRSLHTNPCKTFFPAVRITLPGSDFPGS
ncbi:hypothetical protein AVEN_94178-1 [Araneus ventricosus]|uniref:Uncharacterized protein n=1 Tax=Araneus ventricosus TaxID=182803 RepID=A0A4Y2IYP2_ARAVE|nr:hypothetical protein AVEN_94178-1 [Araneus ventricosus]